MITPEKSMMPALKGANSSQVSRELAGMRAADFADFALHEPPEAVLDLLNALPLPRRAEVFEYLDQRSQVEVCALMDDEALSGLISKMNADERADLFALLDAERQQVVLRLLAQKERDDVWRLTLHKQGTAGAIMTSAYLVIPAHLTAEEAFAFIRTSAPDAETIYQIYVLDESQRISGTLTLRRLILAEPHTVIDAIMNRNVISVRADAPQEEVARLIARYDFIALPVIDADTRMVGIVTYDDAMDVAEQEATEDIHKGASVGSIGGGLRHARLPTLYRKRIGWLLLLVFANIFSGLGIGLFEQTIAAHVVLVFFLPLLIGSGGNAGAQAATLMVRGMATGDVEFSDWTRLLGRELLVAAALGLTMAAAVAGIGLIRGGMEIAFVVGSSMVIVVVVSSLIGMSLPFLLNRLKLDPATASAPLVTSLADVCGVLVYLGIATSILGVPAAS